MSTKRWDSFGALHYGCDMIPIIVVDGEERVVKSC